MGGVILSLFQLILRVSSKLTPNTINKNLGVSKVLSGEDLELWPCDWSCTFMVALVLGSLKANGAIEEYGGKGGMIHLCGA